MALNENRFRLAIREKLAQVAQRSFFHPWICPRPDWAGLGATWDTGR